MASAALHNTPPFARPPCRLQKQRAELLAASPKAKPFPCAQHTQPPSPPLSCRSPPLSRPGSAPPPGMLSASLEQAATELTAKGQDTPGSSSGRVLGCSTTAKAASYWQRWGLERGADFEGFLQRQEKFVQVGGGRGERMADGAEGALVHFRPRRWASMCSTACLACMFMQLLPSTNSRGLHRMPV